MVKVYSFRVWDQAAGDFKVQPTKSTAERIKRIGGEIIEDTAQEVPDDALSADGRYESFDSASQPVFDENGNRVGSIQEPIGPTHASLSKGAFQPNSFQSGAFQGVADPSRVTDPAISPGGRLAITGEGYDQSPPIDHTMFDDAAQTAIAAHHNRRGAATVNAAAGPTMNIGAQTGRFVVGPEPTAGTAPTSVLHSGIHEDTTGAARSAKVIAVFRQHPMEIEALARDISREFARQAETLRGKNDRSEDEDELLDFFNRMAAELAKLSEAIRQAATDPASEPIFLGRAAKISEQLEIGFFEFLKKHRAHIWTVGATGASLYFFSLLGLSPSEALKLLSDILLKK